MAEDKAYLLVQVPNPVITLSAEAKVIDAAGLALWMAICQLNGPSMPCTTSWSAELAAESKLSVRA
jgi:hypothetical protein